MNVWRAFPFFMVMLLAGLQSIPRELYEAAAIDGANLFHEFCYITLPQLRGVIATIVLLDSIWTFRAFDPVYVMTGGGRLMRRRCWRPRSTSTGFRSSNSAMPRRRPW